MKHIIKIYPEYLKPIIDRTKTFELRKNDRNFKVGDIVILREWLPSLEEHTGRHVKIKITYLIKDLPAWGLLDGYCIFSFTIIESRGEVIVTT